MSAKKGPTPFKKPRNANNDQKFQLKNSNYKLYSETPSCFLTDFTRKLLYSYYLLQ